MITILLASLVLAGSLPPCALPGPVTERSPSEHRLIDLGDGRFGVAMEDPLGEPGEHLAGRPSRLPPHPATVGHHWLWSEASDWLLVPDHWIVRRAAVGVDGSWLIALTAPDASGGWMRASGTGQCVGCALSAGAAHFERYRRLAAANEFLFCEDFVRPVSETGRSDRWRRFQYLDDAGKRVSVEVEIDPDGATYRETAIRRD